MDACSSRAMADAAGATEKSGEDDREPDDLDLCFPDSVENFLQIDPCFDDFFQTLTCSHHHLCDPPGPDSTHTHTCTHTHTHVIPAPEGTDTNPGNGGFQAKKSDAPIETWSRCGGGASEAGGEHDGNASSHAVRRKASGNKEAVRKYREKKKAHTAQLKEELSEQKALNQQLLRRLQCQADLEAEVVRLRRVLHEIKAKLDCEFLSLCPTTVPILSAHVPGYSPAMNGFHFPKPPPSGSWVPLPPCPESLATSEHFMLQKVHIPSCDPSLPCVKKQTQRSKRMRTGDKSKKDAALPGNPMAAPEASGTSSAPPQSSLITGTQECSHPL